MTDFTTLHGEPENWRCPDCGVNFVLFPAFPFSHQCKELPAEPQPAYFFYVLKDDHIIESFHVVNAADPNQTCETLAKDGTIQYWPKRDLGGETVFYPPDGYEGEQWLVWRYNPRLQRREPCPRPVMERLALRNRKSVDLGAS